MARLISRYLVIIVSKIKILKDLLEAYSAHYIGHSTSRNQRICSLPVHIKWKLNNSITWSSTLWWPRLVLHPLPCVSPTPVDPFPLLVTAWTDGKHWQFVGEICFPANLYCVCVVCVCVCVCIFFNWFLFISTNLSQFYLIYQLNLCPFVIFHHLARQSQERDCMNIFSFTIFTVVFNQETKVVIKQSIYSVFHKVPRGSHDVNYMQLTSELRGGLLYPSNIDPMVTKLTC